MPPTGHTVLLPTERTVLPMCVRHCNVALASCVIGAWGVQLEPLPWSGCVPFSALRAGLRSPQRLVT